MLFPTSSLRDITDYPSAVFTVFFTHGHVKMVKMVLLRGLFSSRRNLCVWFCCALFLLIFSPRQACAKGNSDVPFSSVPKRYLFIVENSREMQPRARAVFDTLKSLLDATTKTQLRPGDTLAIWTFNDTLNPMWFPFQEWSPEMKLPLAIRVASFSQAESYDKQGNIDKALAQMNQVIRASPDVTVILITSGQGEIRGTTFDAEINKSLKQSSGQQDKANMPVVTSLHGSEGQVAAWAVHAAPVAAEVALLPAAEQKPVKNESESPTSKALQFSTTPLATFPKEKKPEATASQPAAPAPVTPAKAVAMKTEPAPAIPTAAARAERAEEKVPVTIPKASAALAPTPIKQMVEARPAAIPQPVPPTTTPAIAEGSAAVSDRAAAPTSTRAIVLEDPAPKPPPVPQKKEIVESQPKKKVETAPVTIVTQAATKLESQPIAKPATEKTVAAIEPKVEALKPIVAQAPKPAAQAPVAQQTLPKPQPVPEKREFVASEPKKAVEAAPAILPTPPPTKTASQSVATPPTEKPVAVTTIEPKAQTPTANVAPAPKPPAEVAPPKQSEPPPASATASTPSGELTVSAREIETPERKVAPAPVFAAAAPPQQNFWAQNGIWLLILLVAAAGAALCLIMWVRSFSRPQLNLVTLPQPETPTSPAITALPDPAEEPGNSGAASPDEGAFESGQSTGTDG